MRRAVAFVSIFALCAVAAAGAPSCVTETTTPTETGCSTATASLVIVSPADGACVQLATTDAGDLVSGAYIPVVVQAPNFLIRPPGTCSGCYNCGHVVLRVNGQDNNASAASVVDMIFDGKIASYEGEFELTVELVNDDGQTWTAPGIDGGIDGGASDAGTGKPLTATVKVTTSKACPTATSSSSSSSGTGGTGGAGTGGAGTGGVGTGGAGTGGAGTGGAGTGGAGTGGAGTGGVGTGGAGTGGAGTGGT